VLADGESQSFDVWVDVPASASPGDSDLATILAASVASPSVYTDTATLNTLATSGEVAYVTLSDSDLVALIDTTTNSLLGTVNVGAEGCDRPWRASMTPDGDYVYVSCYYSSSVVVIETATNEVVAHITDIYNADGIAFTRDGAFALVGSRFNTQIMIVDTATYTVVNTITTPGSPRSLAAHSYLNVIYATSTSGDVLVIDATTFSILTSIYVGGDPGTSPLSGAAEWVFAGDRWGLALHVSYIPNSLYTTITGLGELTGLEVAPDGAYIYASHLWNGMHVIDAASFELYTTVSGIGTAWEAAVTCDGAELFIGNVSDNVPVIETQNFSVSEYLTLPGSGTRGIAICPQYVASGVILSPHEQTNQGGHGQVVEHQEMLVNVTGSTDSFTLSLGDYIWDTSLSDSTIGPLADGETAVIIVSVSVPVGAPWYSTDWSSLPPTR
jgi:YVTN family beta-propeller protein